MPHIPRWSPTTRPERVYMKIWRRIALSIAALVAVATAMTIAPTMANAVPVCKVSSKGLTSGQERLKVLVAKNGMSAAACETYVGPLVSKMAKIRLNLERNRATVVLKSGAHYRVTGTLRYIYNGPSGTLAIRRHYAGKPFPLVIHWQRHKLVLHGSLFATISS